MIHLFPVEQGLLILEYLSLHDIATIQRVCLLWRNFVRDNAESIYLFAAKFHGYGHGGEELCRRERRIERAWAGHGPAQISFHANGARSMQSIHRFKIDEKNKLIICSYRSCPGIKVWDLKTHTLLWQKEGIQPFAHVEYSNGFLFLNVGDKKEVWRHGPDSDDPPPVKLPYQNDNDRSNRTRGVFRLWAVFTSPKITRMSRLIYPTLLAASETEFYLWDILTARMTCTVTNTQEPRQDTDIGLLTYVDFNQQHIVICGYEGVAVYKRPPKGQTRVEAFKCRVLHISAANYPAHHPATYDVSQESLYPKDQSIIKRLSLERGMITTYPDEQSQFVAAHIDPDSTFLVVIFIHTRLLLIPLALPNPLKHLESFQLGPIHSYSVYLAFERGRVALATTRGIFIVHLPKYSPLNPKLLLSPLRASLVHALTDRDKLGVLSCLQLTENALWVNWGESANNRMGIFDGLDDDLLINPLRSSRTAWVCRVNFDVEETNGSSKNKKKKKKKKTLSKGMDDDDADDAIFGDLSTDTSTA